MHRFNKAPVNLEGAMCNSYILSESLRQNDIWAKGIGYCIMYYSTIIIVLVLIEL